MTASITGTITDPSGAAVTGATVTATSQERGQTYTGGDKRLAVFTVSPNCRSARMASKLKNPGLLWRRIRHSCLL